MGERGDGNRHSPRLTALNKTSSSLQQRLPLEIGFCDNGQLNLFFCLVTGLAKNIFFDVLQNFN